MNLLRTNIWWNTIVPQVVGWIYFCLLSKVFSITDWIDIFNYAPVFLSFFLSLLFTASFGYLLNDLCDVDSDKIAGKNNFISKFKPTIRILLVLLSLLFSLFSWLPLTVLVHPAAHLFFASQIFALMLYSVPPFRLKGRNMAGVFTDAFYGHINPVIITLLVFGFFSFTHPVNRLLIFILLPVLATKGIRNILLHQIEDRKKDRKANIHTAVLKYKPLTILNFINHFLLKLEMVFLTLLVVIISIDIPPFFISLVIFSVFTYFKFSGWKLSYLPKRQLKFKFLFFLNDYYEGWVPVFFLLILCVRQPEFLFLLPVHFILFPSFVNKLWKDIKTIKQNLETEHDY